jgi:DNA ligase (NAD+)
MQISKHTQELETLQKLGFAVNPFNSTCNSLEEIWLAYEDLDTKRDGLNYPIDGLVAKLNDNDIVNQLGVIGKTPRGWSAMKFKAQEVTTQILSLDFQVGRTGKITPVANLKAVELQGTTVKRATLHNVQEIKDSCLHVGDTVIIRKAGDIIPEIVSVLTNLRNKDAKEFLIPSICPCCRSVLIESKTAIDLCCPNKNGCKDQVKSRLSYFTTRGLANIDGLSEKTIEKFIEVFGISTIDDLYKLDYKAISQIEGFGHKSSEKLETSINKAKNLLDYKFLAGLGIEGIGIESAKEICKIL